MTSDVIEKSLGRLRPASAMAFTGNATVSDERIVSRREGSDFQILAQFAPDAPMTPIFIFPFSGSIPFSFADHRDGFDFKQILFAVALFHHHQRTRLEGQGHIRHIIRPW
jgi:hypothetical protein